MRPLGPLLAFGLAGCATTIIPRTSAPAPSPGDVAATVFLIGDAGAPARDGEPVLRALDRALASRPDSTLVVFLGDNLYPAGLPDSGDAFFPEAQRRLAAQVAYARHVRVVFIPGNHDWDRSGREGLVRIRRQGRFIGRESGGRARLVPADGCPGPEAVDVGPGLRLLLLDTEWWLFPHEKPGEGSGCAAATESTVAARLERLLDEAAGRQVIVAGHHPLLSGGPHGGYFSIGDHLFPLRNLHPALFLPLPVIGSLYPLARDMGISPEDMNGGPYRRLRAALDGAFACEAPALYVAGHDHSLQLLDRGRPPLIAVSGAGIYGHESHVERLPETRLAASKPGFMRVDLLRNGRLRVAVLLASRQGEPREAHALILPAAAPHPGGCGVAGAAIPSGDTR